MNAGFNNIGYVNSGNNNAGNYNAGDNNTGDNNAGNYNTGDYNTGDYNIGDWNTGDWNKTSFSSGCFNTIESTIAFFNEPSTWTYRDWLESYAKTILDDLKDVAMQSRQDWWNCLSEDQRNTVRAIPNFNEEIFEEITGIKVSAQEGEDTHEQ